MKNKLIRWLAHFWRAEFFSPRGFVLRALAIVTVFIVAHLAGWREYTSILNGTVGPGSAGRELSTAFGVTYVLAYLGVVVIVPVFILAAGILAVWQRRRTGI